MASAEDEAQIFSVAFQKSVIGGSLNATLLFFFLSGAYLGLYTATIVIYLSNNSPYRRVVLICLTVLFLAFLIQLCGQWYQTALVFVGVSATREDIFNLTVGLNDVSLPALGIILTATNLISQTLADALLVWRCIYACDLSPVRLSALIILFIAEITLDFTTFVLDALLDFVPKYQTDAHDRLYNKVLGASLFVTAATSMLATSIIGYRIYASTARCKGSWKRYRYIVEIIVQSSAIYSITALCFAIVASIDNAELLQQQGTVLWNAVQYILAFTYIVPAAAPTLMVVRLAWARSNKSMKFSSIDDRSLSRPTNIISAFTSPDMPMPKEHGEISVGEIEEIGCGTVPAEVSRDTDSTVMV